MFDTDTKQGAERLAGKILEGTMIDELPMPVEKLRAEIAAIIEADEGQRAMVEFAERFNHLSGMFRKDDGTWIAIWHAHAPQMICDAARQALALYNGEGE